MQNDFSCVHKAVMCRIKLIEFIVRQVSHRRLAHKHKLSSNTHNTKSTTTHRQYTTTQDKTHHLRARPAHLQRSKHLHEHLEQDVENHNDNRDAGLCAGLDLRPAVRQHIKAGEQPIRLLANSATTEQVASERQSGHALQPFASSSQTKLTRPGTRCSAAVRLPTRCHSCLRMACSPETGRSSSKASMT